MFSLLGARANTTGAKRSRTERVQRAREGGRREDGGSDEEDEAVTDGSVQRVSILLGTAKHMSKVGREDCSAREQDGRVSTKPGSGSRVPIQRSD